jgi:glycogen debranching enzyme
MERAVRPGGDPWGTVAQDVHDVEPDAFEESEPVPATTVTLVEGASFAICGLRGDVESGGVEGVFVGDTRICSRLQLTIDGELVEPLTLAVRSPSSATFVGRTADRRLLVFRDLWVGQGMRQDVRVRNLAREPRDATIRLAAGADLAELFDVKRGVVPPARVACEADGDVLRFEDERRRRGLRLRGGASPVALPDGQLEWRVEVAPGATWETCVELVALRDREEVASLYPCGRPPEQVPALTGRLGWRRELPVVSSDVPGLAHAVLRTGDDLAALRLVDPDHPEDVLIAAGAPWYMTLFGRDSLLSSWMALALDPALGLGTARTLARLQGRRDDPETEEQPGRILHEVRFSRGPSLRLADGDVYYGTVDATPLFVMLVHELWRWGVDEAEIEALRPAVDAALGWLDGPGDADGDGFVEYGAPSGPRSLANQGWKDSHDSVAFADGRLAEAPIAIAEAQGYAFAAWRAGAALAAAAGDPRTAAARAAKAEELRAAFEAAFWLPEAEAYALALDREKRPVDAIASNMGHLLWSGIVADPDRAAAVARHLVSPELFTGWGIRTLSTSMTRYSPLSYHNGSVWPHDTAICAAGLRRAGFVQEANRVAGGLLSAAEALGGRLPELFAGLTADELPMPVRYPTSCSPQAWASAAPLLLLRSFLGLEADVPNGRVEVDPALPDGASSLALAELPFAGGRVTIEVDGDALAVRGLDRGLALLRPGG